MLIQGQVAQNISATRASGQPTALLAQLGELGVSEVLPRYGAMAWSGLMYFGANTAAQPLSVNSTTFTGLAVGNPTGSGKNLVIIDVACALAAVPTGVNTPRIGYAATVTLTTGSSTGPKGLPVLVGSSGGSVATVGASGTLTAAPTTIRPILGIHWVTANAVVANVYAKDEVAGAIIIPPGQMLTLDTFTTAQSVIASATWLELPV